MNRAFPTLFKPRLEMNITELCNLTCDFCPRAHGYPNENLHMSMDMLDLVLENQLEVFNRHNYRMPLFVIGRGEPSLHNDWENFVNKIYEFSVKHYGIKFGIDMIHTNGYKWKTWVPKLAHMFGQIDLNCYPNKTYLQFLQIRESLAPYENVCVHDRGVAGSNEATYETQTRTNQHGTTTPVVLNNRGGSIPTDIIPTLNLNEAHGKVCSKPWQMLYIDWDGEWRICCNDWTDLVSLGNIKETSLLDHLWNNPKFNEYRWRLANGDRSMTPCNKCNASVMSSEKGWYRNLEELKEMNPRWLRNTKEQIVLKK